LLLFYAYTYQALLDFSRDFDVALLDKVVMAFYTSSGPEVVLFYMTMSVEPNIAFICTATNGPTDFDSV